MSLPRMYWPSRPQATVHTALSGNRAKSLGRLKVARSAQAICWPRLPYKYGIATSPADLPIHLHDEAGFEVKS